MDFKHLAILTGSEGQLGVAIAQFLHQCSCDVIGIDVSSTSRNSYCSTYISGDITLTASLDKLFSLSVHDIASNYRSISLVNNAGIAIFTPSEDRTYNEYRRVTDVNLWAPLQCTTRFFRKLEEYDHIYPNQKLQASCVNISSIYGVVTPNPMLYVDTPRNSSEIYGASKAALNHLTRYFATRYASRMCVNSVCPGGILNRSVQSDEFLRRYSSLVPMGRLCSEYDVASMVKFLCIDRPSYLTGQVIALDGGLTAW